MNIASDEVLRLVLILLRKNGGRLWKYGEGLYVHTIPSMQNRGFLDIVLVWDQLFWKTRTVKKSAIECVHYCSINDMGEAPEKLRDLLEARDEASWLKEPRPIAIHEVIVTEPKS